MLAQNRFSALGAGALAALTLGMLAQAGAAAGAGNPGGTAAGSGTTSTHAGGTSTTSPSKHAPHAAASKLTGVSCVPSSHCSTNPHQVSTHGTLLVQGSGLRSGMVLAFPASPGGTARSNTPQARLRATRLGLVAIVPNAAHSGKVMVLLGRGRSTNTYGPIQVFKHALHPPVTKTPTPVIAGGASAGPLEGQGMWIWYVNRSSGGSVPAIIAQAHAGGVTTVFVKSSDGSSNYWGQFSPQLVAELHAGGLKVCAWQYVYGTNPAGEATLGAEAVANGADCLVIDAEGEYEGHYAAAQTYIGDLRAKIGPSYPLALASFPYVSYHPSFPYSVFLGPGGAQFNAPQMYWKDIGVSVDTVYANTYIANRIYARPIFPLGQTYGGVSSSDLLRFREEAVDYGASGWSFWDWQETGASGWSTLNAPLAPLSTVTPNTTFPELAKGAKGDQVLWLQEHLAAAAPTQETTGVFGSETTANLEAFQTAHGIPPSGISDAATWTALLALAPVEVKWTGKGPST
jgi:hypothetical protein